MRCKHERLDPFVTDDRSIQVTCYDCKLTWFGSRWPWRSAQGKLHKAPRWVQKVLDTINGRE